MGNQGHSSEHIRLLKEWLEDGAIGDVREVHAWTDRPVGGQVWSTFAVKAKSLERPAIPASLDWDLWLGPAPFRHYHPDYHPKTWRAWIDFGTGPLGDMGCHILDPAFWALELGAPDKINASTTHWEEDVSSQTFPRASIVRYDFPARGKKPPVKLTWYDGRLLPPRPDSLEPDRELPKSGAIIYGDKGAILHGSHGASSVRLFPESKMKAYKMPKKTYPRIQGDHEADWIRACKEGPDGTPASSSFEYGGALTEMVLLGMAAIQMKDQNLYWNSRKMEFTNNAEANAPSTRPTGTVGSCSFVGALPAATPEGGILQVIRGHRHTTDSCLARQVWRSFRAIFPLASLKGRARRPGVPCKRLARLSSPTCDVRVFSSTPKGKCDRPI